METIQEVIDNRKNELLHSEGNIIAWKEHEVIIMSEIYANQFKGLLKKYIRYVYEVEGSDYIKYDDKPFSDVEFSESEWDLLEEISQTVNPEQ